MKKWVTVICLASFTLYCHAAPQRLSSAIKAVTVYSDRAAVTRQAAIELTAGDHELTFENLPVGLENNSLQVTATASAAATILDVTTQQARRISNANERLQALDKQLDDLKEQLAKLNDQQAIVTSQLDFIKKMQDSAVGINDKANRPTINQVQQIMALSNQSLTALLSEQRTIANQTEQLNKELQVLQQQRYPLERERNQPIKNITVKVHLTQSGKLNLNLNYITYGASWYPIYDARLNSKNQQLSLSYFAQVNQHTGEDWHDVKLTLSTARPALSGNAPQLSDWHLSEHKAAINGNLHNRSQRANAEKKLAASSGASFTAKQSYKPIPPQPVRLDTSATSAAFVISTPTSLLSGKGQQKVTITTIAHLTSDLRYQLVPRLSQVAYLQADTVNTSDYPLIAGKLNTFMDGRFIATSQLKTIMPHEQFKLDLGIDESIAVQFKQIKRFTEKTGITNSGERITYHYEITVQNNKNRDVKLQISDHIPVSQNDNIKVKLVTPKDITADKEGKLVWNKTLKAREKQLIPISFTIDYPVKTQVIGL